MNRTETLEQIREQIEEWGTELDELEELARSTSDDDGDWENTDEEHGDTLHDLRMTWEDLRITFEETENSDEESYEELLEALTSQMEEFEEAFTQAKEELKAA